MSSAFKMQLLIILFLTREGGRNFVMKTYLLFKKQRLRIAVWLKTKDPFGALLGEFVLYTINPAERDPTYRLRWGEILYYQLQGYMNNNELLKLVVNMFLSIQPAAIKVQLRSLSNGSNLLSIVLQPFVTKAKFDIISR